MSTRNVKAAMFNGDGKHISVYDEKSCVANLRIDTQHRFEFPCFKKKSNWLQTVVRGKCAAAFLHETLQDHFLPCCCCCCWTQRSPPRTTAAFSLATLDQSWPRACLQPRHCLAMLGQDTQARRGWPKWPGHYQALSRPPSPHKWVECCLLPEWV